MRRNMRNILIVGVLAQATILALGAVTGCKPREEADPQDAYLARYAGKTIHCIRKVDYTDIRIHFTDEDTLRIDIYKYRPKFNGLD